MSAGIERLAVYVPQLQLALDQLADARGADPAAWASSVGARTLRAAPACEDAATMAASAGLRVLRAADLNPDDVGMLLVASASASLRAGVVHELLRLGHHCRMATLGPGGHASTAALMAAADWARAARGRLRRALVIAADVVRHPAGSALEPTSGAGAVAMLVSQEPFLLQLADESGTWAAADDGSERAWLEAVEGTLAMLRPLERPEPVGEEVLTDRFAHVCYQAISPARARAAHRRLVDADWRQNAHRRAAAAGDHEARLAAAVAEQVEPGLMLLERVGDAGAATPFLALASLLESDARRLGGRRVACFGFGGGCAELFSGLVPARAQTVAEAGVRAALTSATPIDVAAWDALADAEPGGGRPERFAGDFVRVPDGGYHRVTS
jgi:hydroxymethylglutaryl-CoA synthase